MRCLRDWLPGWSADPRAEHRWLAPEDVKVDILPAGPNLRRAGTLRWPRSGNEMSLLDQKLAFEQARDVRVASVVRDAVRSGLLLALRSAAPRCLRDPAARRCATHARIA